MLEHLRQPERILAACRKRLTPEGRLLISVPNAGYSGLVAELLHGEFRYREEGLLDRTHLRFFTRRSLSRFLVEQGWQVDDIDTIERALPESEFRVAYDSLPPAVARHLLATPDALAYQFIASAAPAAQALPIEPPLNYPQGHALFTAQLYMARAGRYEEESKLSTTGIIGQARQTLRFALPDHNTSLSHLRLDLADRPGFVHLYRLALLDGQGAVVWQWRPEDSDAALLGQRPHHQLVWNGPHPAGAFALMLLLTGDDPWFELPIPAETLAPCVAPRWRSRWDGPCRPTIWRWPVPCSRLSGRSRRNAAGPMICRISGTHSACCLSSSMRRMSSNWKSTALRSIGCSTAMPSWKTATSHRARSAPSGNRKPPAYSGTSHGWNNTCAT